MSIVREPINELLHDPLEFTKDIKFPDPKEIKIYDSTLRDGEQMPGVAYSPEQKVEIVKRLSDIGVHIVDVGFPGVSESERKALRLIMEAKRRGELRDDFEILVMCRSNKHDIDATLQVLDSINIAPDEVTFFIFTSGSDLHLKYKLGKTLLAREGKPESEWLELPVQWYRDANIRMMVDAIKYARSQGVKSIEFGGEDGSRGDVDYSIQLFNEGLKAGATRPSWPDTVGCLTPEATEWYVSRIVAGIPKDVPLLIHFHNDYGLGTINTITALKAGAKIFCTTVNAYGERAGNAPLHEVVTALKLLYGVEIPGFKYNKLNELAHFVEELTGYPIQANEPIIGRNVFSHESGIHTAGMLIDKRIYEAIPTEVVGATTRFVYGKHSGTQIIEDSLRRNEARLAAAGVAITPELVKKVTEEVKRIRDERISTETTRKMIQSYYKMIDSLGLNDEDVFELAKSLGTAKAAS